MNSFDAMLTAPRTLRGVQAILGFIMYRTFTKSLAQHMERSPVSFGTFESVSLHGASVQALVTLVRDYLTNSGIRAKLTVTWMILALSYVLIFPTLMSAMTRYSGTSWHSTFPHMDKIQHYLLSVGSNNHSALHSDSGWQ